MSTTTKNPNETISGNGRRIGLCITINVSCIRLTGNSVPCQTDQRHVLVNQQRTRSQKRDLERANMPSHTVRVYIYQHLVKG